MIKQTFIPIASEDCLARYIQENRWDVFTRLLQVLEYLVYQKTFGVDKFNKIKYPENFNSEDDKYFNWTNLKTAIKDFGIEFKPGYKTGTHSEAGGKLISPKTDKERFAIETDGQSFRLYWYNP